MIKIFIAENVPALNKGEMTILEGMLESFKILGEVEVTMLSSLPEIDQPRYGTKVKIIDAKKSLHLFGNPKGYNKVIAVLASIFVTLQHMFFLILYRLFGPRAVKFMKSEIWKAYVESDAILVGHDGTFGIGAGLGIVHFFSFLFIPFLSKIVGKPLVIYGGSVPRFSQYNFLDKLEKLALSRVDLITLREEAGYQNLKHSRLQNERVSVVGDPAFLLQPAPFEQIKKIMIQEGIDIASKPLIGMTVTREIASMAFSDTTSSEDSYLKHVRMLAEVIDKLTDMLNATVIFIPHCIGFGEKLDDRIVAGDIFQVCRNKDRVKVITKEYGAGELKGLIGQLDLFIGERLHSVINAMSMCVPSIALSLSTDQRLNIIKMFGQENAICYVETLDADALVSKINDVWAKRNKIREELKSQTEIIKERAMLNGKLLKKLLDSRR